MSKETAERAASAAPKATLAAIPAKRASTERQPPLGHQHGAVVRYVAEANRHSVYAAPGYQLFVEAMWNGVYQQIPVDPLEVDGLIAALEAARDYCEIAKRGENDPAMRAV